MALATRCPHCKTTFKVANDQLKLRAGLVRCGACKEIFNGIEHLLRPDAVEQPASAAPAHAPASFSSSASFSSPSAAASAPPAAPVVEAEPSAKPDTASNEQTPDIASFLKSGPSTANAGTESSEPETAGQPGPAAPAAPLDPAYHGAYHNHSADNDPLQRMTLVDFSYADDDDDTAADNATADKDKVEPETETETETETKPQPKPDPDQPDPLEKAIEELQRRPLRREKKSARKHRRAAHEDDDSDAEEPDFVKDARRRENIGRKVRLLMGIASILMLFTLAAQSTYVFRNRLAVWFPQARLVLEQACAPLGCWIDLPAQIEAVSIESSELQTVAPEKNTFSLTLLLRNHSATAQAWPHIELTLNDANEQAIARRVFTPREYVGTQQESTGFGAKSEQSFKVFFELSEIKASGYRVYVFYP